MSPRPTRRESNLVRCHACGKLSVLDDAHFDDRGRVWCPACRPDLDSIDERRTAGVSP